METHIIPAKLKSIDDSERMVKYEIASCMRRRVWELLWSRVDEKIEQPGDKIYDELEHRIK